MLAGKNCLRENKEYLLGSIMPFLDLHVIGCSSPLNLAKNLNLSDLKTFMIARQEGLYSFISFFLTMFQCFKGFCKHSKSLLWKLLITCFEQCFFLSLFVKLPVTAYWLNFFLKVISIFMDYKWFGVLKTHTHFGVVWFSQVLLKFPFECARKSSWL